jgi:transcription elongation factor GreA-like protein/transcription elongation GreA/GreB family factor
VLKLILDLETTNSDELAQITYDTLKERYGTHDYFGEKIRLIGLRSRDSFQGALTNYELLTHLDKGKFVFHTGGWGTGEILDISLVREQLSLEFENVIGKRDFTFQNAFKHLIPLEDTHFLARRFGDPDNLEAAAKKDAVAVCHMLLRDLGPKTAAEIKDEMCELVIPEEDWTKWWQSARSKLKKDTKVQTPSSVREPFVLRESELSHEERFKTEFDKQHSIDSLILTTYNFVRDFSEVAKNEDLKEHVRQRFLLVLESETTEAQRLQIQILFELLFDDEARKEPVSAFIRKSESIEELINAIDIIAFKKRALLAVRQNREDWPELFLSLVITIPQTPLRDYLLKELNKDDVTREQLKESLVELRRFPSKNPETLVWYFQRVIADPSLPLADLDNRNRFFESFFVLLCKIEHNPDYRDLVKKMLQMVANKRYAMIRQLMEDMNFKDCEEILLLASKCHCLTEHDKKILLSLAQVVHPTIGRDAGETKIEEHTDSSIMWTTESGYQETAERIRHMSEVEVVDNAREIEAARALGDLRENSEYKFALERRSRLQAELKMLSDALSQARIITPEDISAETAGVGNIVEIEDSQGTRSSYTLLGPWDADPDKNILSMQSKLAQAMCGHGVGESFEHQGETMTVKSLNNYLMAEKS